MDSDVYNDANSFVLTVKVVPGSSRTDIVGKHGDMLKVKVAAPPEKGKANKELQRYLAKQLGIKSKDIQIQSGHTSCVKQILIRGAKEENVQTLFSV